MAAASRPRRTRSSCFHRHAAGETNPKNEEVDVNIIGDPALITEFVSLLANPQIAGLSGGKIVRIGKERAVQDKNGDINMVVANKYLIAVKGSGPQGWRCS